MKISLLASLIRAVTKAASTRTLAIFVATVAIAGAAQMPTPATVTADALRREMRDPDASRIFIVAHRADWRHYPENSLEGIASCIKLGIEAVEIDVMRTKDGHFVLMHDSNVDRTTTGKGKVSELTLAEVKALHLRDGLGSATPFRVPTLREALELAHGKILVNLDKSERHLAEIGPILVETRTISQVILKGAGPVDKVQRSLGQLADQVMFMPVIKIGQPGALALLRDWLATRRVPSVELVFGKLDDDVDTAFHLCRENGVRIWVNTLWPNLAGGLSDDLAVNEPDRIYGMFIDRGVTILQTDRPRELQSYIRGKQPRKN